jgi:hypothetical protein
MQTLLHDPSWPRFALAVSTGGICLLILLMLNLLGQRWERMQREASGDFIAEMLRREKSDDAPRPRRELSRSQKQVRRVGGLVFRGIP